VFSVQCSVFGVQCSVKPLTDKRKTEIGKLAKMILRFPCPNCDHYGRVELTGALIWVCADCGRAMPLTKPEPADDMPVTECAACRNAELYRQKNFPQWLGLSLLALACGSFFVLQILYLPWIAWAVLLGSAGADGLLYAFVGDALVCYRCGAKHTGLPKCRVYDPFELATAEKYRQERIRREMAVPSSKFQVPGSDRQNSRS
jgi:ribosomal protein L37AE/L43A